MSQLHPVDLGNAVWRRSSFASEGDEPQVEVAMLDDGHVAMRASGQRDALVFTPAEWDAFVAGAKDGEFDPADAPEPEPR